MNNESQQEKGTEQEIAKNENIDSMFNSETIRLLKGLEELFFREYYKHVDIYKDIIERYSLYYLLVKYYYENNPETSARSSDDKEKFKKFEKLFNDLIRLSASRLGESEKENLIKKVFCDSIDNAQYIDIITKQLDDPNFWERVNKEIYKNKVLLQSFINIDISFEKIKEELIKKELKKKKNLKIIKVFDEKGKINYEVKQDDIIEINEANLKAQFETVCESIRDYFKVILDSEVYPLKKLTEGDQNHPDIQHKFIVMDDLVQVVQEGKEDNSRIRIKINHLLPIPRHFDAAFLGISTDIEGLDKLFGGKWLIPAFFPVVISINGEAGTGKTIFTLQVCSAFARKKSLVLYLTLEQKAEELENIMSNFGFNCVFDTIIIGDKCPRIKETFANIASKNNESGVILFIKIDRFTIWELLETFNTLIDADAHEASCENGKSKVEDFLKEFSRKFLVVDTLNAVDGFDSNDHKWRQNLSNFIDKVDDFKFSTIFLNEKKKDDPDNFVDYISDFVFRLHKTVEEVSGLRIETRHFEVTKSRMQYAHFGESTFIIRKNGIEIYPSPFIMTESHPTQKYVIDPDRNPKEYGIKINGVMDFFKSFHSKDRLMKPFWYKNSFTLLEGSLGTLKSNFAKFIVKSAFRDEIWINANDEQIEFDYRDEEVDKPQYEILKILVQGGKPIEKKIGLLVLFGEDFKYSERYDIIWETDFGKIIIPNCKSEEGEPKRFVHVSIIVIQFKISSYLSNVYLSIIEKIAKAVELFKIHDEVPMEYKEFIDPIGRYNEIGENLKKRKDSLFYLIYNPFKYIYTPKYFRKEPSEKIFSISLKKDAGKKSISFSGEPKYFNKELKKIQFIDGYYTSFIKLLFDIESPGTKTKPNGETTNKIELILDTTKIIMIKLINLVNSDPKYISNTELVDSINEKESIADLFDHIKNIGDNNKNETILLDLLFLVKRWISNLKLKPDDEVKKPDINYNYKELDLAKLEKFLSFFTLLYYTYLIYLKLKKRKAKFYEKYIAIIDFSIIILMDEKDIQFDNHKNNSKHLKYLRKLRWDSLFYDIEIEKKDDSSFIVSKRISNEYISYENAKFIKVSRIVVDDLVKVGKAFPMVKDEEFLPILYSFCLSNFISLFVVNTLISKEEKTDFDIQAESLAHTILGFDEILYQGNSYKILSIKKSSSRFHNIRTFEIIKKEEEILQVRSTFDLLINLETRPELLKIRLFLYEGSQLNYNTPFGMLLDNPSSINIPDIMPITEANIANIKVEDKPEERRVQFTVGSLKNTLQQYNNFLVDSLKFNLGHPEIEYFKNPKFFSDINLTFSEEIEFTEGVIGIIMIQDYRLYCNGTKLKKLSYYIKITDQEGEKIFLKKNKQDHKLEIQDHKLEIQDHKLEILEKIKKNNTIKDEDDTFLFGVSEYYHADFEGCVQTKTKRDSARKISFLENRKNRDGIGKYLPDILQPAIYRDNKYKIVIREKDYGKKDEGKKFCHFIALPYYMDPGVLLIEVDNGLYEEYLRKPKDFTKIKNTIELFGDVKKFNFMTFRFTHRTAEDLMGFLIELLINIYNKEDENKVFNKQFICIKWLIKELIKNKNFAELIGSLGEYYDPFNENEYSEKIIVRREWYSTAVEKIRMFRQIYGEKDSKRYIIAPLGKRSVSINWYLALLKGSSREEIGAKIITHLCSPENSIKMMQNGIGMSPYKDVYSFKGKDINDNSYIFLEMGLNAKKTGEIVKNSISLAKFPCYHRIAPVVGMFFHQLLSRIMEIKQNEKRKKDINTKSIDHFVKDEFKGILLKIESLCDQNYPCPYKSGEENK